MKSLFGAPMDDIMHWMLGIFLVVTAVVAVLASRNRLLLKLGLRNVPRRRAQTLLIVVGLMLSTVIITSAFGTGDTLSYSIRTSAVTGLGAIDETVTANTQALGRFGNTSTAGAFFPSTTVGRIQHALAPGNAIDGVLGVIVQEVPLQDLSSRQTKANILLTGIPAYYPPAFGPLTLADGSEATLAQLGPHEVYINQYTADALNAHQGDTVRVYVANQAETFTVRGILNNEGLAAGGLGPNASRAMLLPLDHVQQLAGALLRTTSRGQLLPDVALNRINAVLISNRGDALTGATLSKTVTDQLGPLLLNPKPVAKVKHLLSTAAGQRALSTLIHDPSNLTPTVLQQLREVQAEVRQAGISARLKVLLSDTDVANALMNIKSPDAIAIPLTAATHALSGYSIQTVKQDALDTADQAGSEVTTVFVVFGLFSIAAGVLLIFLIFVMLAAERRPEMGVARAIGTKRRHLIQQFLFEGYAYDLGAALVGVGLGIGVSLGIAAILTNIFSGFLSGSGFYLQRHIEPRSVVVAFCLGALVTFVTVAFSSWRISRLNVVAAIRDLAEDIHKDGSIAAAFRQPLTDLAAAGRRLRRGRVLAALRALLAAPWHLLTAFRVFIGRGPLLLVGGWLLLQYGYSIKQLWPVGIGMSLLLIGAAMQLRWIMGALGVSDRVRNRLGYSLAGLSLVVFWLLPFDTMGANLHFDIEMFFISGMLLMLGGIWTVMYNIDVVLGGLLLVFGNLGRLAPIIKTAVTYPMQHRFRTGLTLFMFSLVVFSLMVQEVLIGSFSSRPLDLACSNGGYDIVGTVGSSNPIHDLSAQLAAHPTLRRQITASGGLTVITADLRQHTAGKKMGLNTWEFPIAVADTSFLTSTHLPLYGRATGFGSDQQVWQMLRDHPGYAVVTNWLVPSHSAANNGSGDQLQGIYREDRAFKPLRLELQDPNTGTMAPVTIIGVLDDQGVSDLGFRFPVYTGDKTLTVAGASMPMPNRYFFRVAPGQDVHQTALALGSAFLPNGMDVSEVLKEYNQNLSAQVGFNYLLEGFMALGLVVGIAALGVIAMRAVVERRQQIGMMRAIGFQRHTVRTSFLLESSFVAVLGTLIGVVLGLLLARQLITFFAKSDQGLHVVIPWGQIGLIVLLAYAASLLTTYLPARQASHIYPAEALRYE